MTRLQGVGAESTRCQLGVSEQCRIFFLISNRRNTNLIVYILYLKVLTNKSP